MNKNKKIIFITGTPGIGKTTVASHLNKKLNKKYNSKIFKINEIAIENDLILGKDSERGYKIVDIDKLNKKLPEIINNEYIEDLKVIGENYETNDLNNKVKNYDVLESNDLDILVESKDNIEDFNHKIKNIEKNVCISKKRLEIAIVEGHLSHLCDNCDKVIVLRLDPESLEKRLKKRDYSKEKIQENLEAESLAVCAVEAFEIHGDIVSEIDTTGKSIDEVVTNIIKIIHNEKKFSVGKIDFMEWLKR